MHRILSEYPGKVRLVVKTFPYKYRHFAHIAAEAAHSAWGQGSGKFEAMHNIMIENSPRLDRESLMAYARQAGLDMKKFSADLNGMRHSKEVDEVNKLATELDLFNTPTFFINGRKIVGNAPYEFLKKVVDEELAKPVD